MQLSDLGYKYILIVAVPKILGAWTNEGTCQAAGQDPACGPGTPRPGGPGARPGTASTESGSTS